MKVFITGLMLILYSSVCLAKTPDISEIRSLYKQAAIEESACQKLLEILKPYNPGNNPLLAGYKACSLILMAKHAINPLKKWAYFKEGKALLNEAINTDKDNVELRFLRLMVQTSAPSFLGYQDAVEKDKGFLLKNVAELNDLTLKKWIIGFLSKSSDI